MTKFNWTNITRDDVLKAINIFNMDNPEYPEPKVTFLIYKNQKLPAKHIRGMAYKVAYGKDIKKSDYGGGMETVRFFERLGFEMHYTGKTKREDNKTGGKKKLKEGKGKIDLPAKAGPNPDVETKPVKTAIPLKDVIEQKNALQLLLNIIFNGDLVCEKTFPWLKSPSSIEGSYKDLYKALSDYRGDKTFAKKNIVLRCDFVCESKKIIVEYDERQHFTEARKISLLSYTDIKLDYNRELWIKACEDIQAKDNHPFNRDEIRAYYDSIRDIEASRNGYKLIRIMHGQMDFESDNAEAELRELLGTSNADKTKEIKSETGIISKDGLKIGLYLQTDELKNRKNFYKALRKARKSEFDILVLPESSYFPFITMVKKSDIFNERDVYRIYEAGLDLSKKIKKAIIISSIDKHDTIFSFYANAFADENETEVALYVKHTATYSSAFDSNSYDRLAHTVFEPIVYKGYRIGMTICYDCNHSLFSRLYGLQGIDILINSTGGDVVYDKWYKYNKVRAIENSSYNFVTMGGDGTVSNPKNYVYGFNRQGKELRPINEKDGDDRLNIPGNIYIYDTSLDDGEPSIDTSLNQAKSVNKNHHLELPVGRTSEILKKARKVRENIYIYPAGDTNIIFCVIEGDDILKPEKVLSLLYSEDLNEVNNKRYIIINKYKSIDEEFYGNKLSVVLKVRSMENFCAVILESDNINNCYQSGKNRTAQVIKDVDGLYKIDLSRTTGPEAIWKNKIGMKASWRKKFQWLIDNANKI